MSLIWCTQCEYEEECSLRAVAKDLDGCSGHSRLHHRYAEEKEKLQKEAIEKIEERKKLNGQPLESFKIGYRVRLKGSTKSLGLNLPQYLDNGDFKVVGFTKNGKIKCDWDGGKPFNIPAGCLKIMENDI